MPQIMLNRYLFNMMENYVDELGLEQLVEFQTWSRLVNRSLRTSVLDHIYSNDGTMISNIEGYK